MDDLISRQAILDMLEDINNHIIDGYGYKHDWCVEWVKGLPSIDAEPQWIPCSERLPEEKKWYLITVHPEYVPEYCGQVDLLMWHNGEWQFLNEKAEWEKWPDPIIAWMPLPKPYEERKEE